MLEGIIEQVEGRAQAVSSGARRGREEDEAGQGGHPRIPLLGANKGCWVLRFVSDVAPSDAQLRLCTSCT